MSKRFWIVVADDNDPGSYHTTEADALRILRYLQGAGYPNAIIHYPTEG